MTEPFTVRGEPRKHLRRSVDRDAFLVAGDEQADRTIGFAACEIARSGGDECRDGGLHVGGTAPIERAVLDHGAERIMMPEFCLTRRDDIGVSCETEIRTLRADPGV